MLYTCKQNSFLSLNFPKGTKGLTCPTGINMLPFLVADSILSLNFPKGTKGLTCPAGINRLRFLVADSVLSLNGQIGTCPPGVDMLPFLATEFHSVAGQNKVPRTGTNRPNMPRNGKHVTVPCNRFHFRC